MLDQKVEVVRYDRDFVITVIIITEFDCTYYIIFLSRWSRDHEEAWLSIFRFIIFFLKLGYGGIQLILDERLKIQVAISSMFYARIFRTNVFPLLRICL